MQSETAKLVEAIQSLKHENNFYIDFIIPFATPLIASFIGAITGALIAYWLVRRQENLKSEIKKLEIINKWILLADEARINLTSIKKNYLNLLKENPYQRAFKVPAIIMQSKPITETYSELSFLTPKQPINDIPKWSQIPRIRMMFENYNYVQEIWLKRNLIDRPIKEKLAQINTNDAYSKLDLDTIFQLVHPSKISELIDLTEHAITLTDDLIIELNDFLTNVPSYAKSLIDTEKTKRYGNVFTFQDTDSINDSLIKSPKANYELITALTGNTAEQLEKRYSTGYYN